MQEEMPWLSDPLRMDSTALGIWSNSIAAYS